jgi:hypothetical protein
VAPGGEVVGDEGDFGEVGTWGVGGVDEIVHNDPAALLVCFKEWVVGVVRSSGGCSRGDISPLEDYVVRR